MPSALFISAEDGLQPNVVVVPPVMMAGTVLSAVHVTVLEAVAVLPQTSIAVHVLVCDREQEVVTIEPSLDVNVEPPQSSVAVAVPSAALISLATGLQPKVDVVPDVVIVGTKAFVVFSSIATESSFVSRTTPKNDVY